MRESPVINPAAATTSIRIIAAATVIAACYVASSVIITLICSIFIAFVLDPVVQLTERIRCPRWLGAIMIVLLALGFLSLLGFLVYGRLVEFIAELPLLSARIQEIVARVLQPLESWASSAFLCLAALRSALLRPVDTGVSASCGASASSCRLTSATTSRSATRIIDMKRPSIRGGFSILARLPSICFTCSSC